MQNRHLHNDTIRVFKCEWYAYLEFGWLLLTTTYGDVVGIQICAKAGVQNWVEAAAQAMYMAGAMANG
jgi:hypothetical protein